MIISRKQRLGAVQLLIAVALLCLTARAIAQDAQAAVPPVTQALALQRLLSDTLANNPGVQAAQAALDAAEARVVAAGQPIYNPGLELNADQAETRTGTIGLSQTIDWADKRGARAAVAGADRDRAQAEYNAQRQQLIAELIGALGRYHSAVELQRLGEQRRELMARFLALAEKRRRAGDLSQVELDLARLAQTQATLQLAQLASDLALAEQDLIAVTGQANHDWPELPEDLPALGEVDPDAFLRVLPVVRAQQSRVRVANASIKLRVRERRADPTVGVRVGQERAFQNGNNDVSGVIGVTLSVPLFVRNSYRAEVQAATADLTQAEQTLQGTYRQARAQLLSTADRYQRGRNAWQVWVSTGQASLGNQVSALERIWRAGEMSTAAYLVQLNQTLDTRSEALKVRGRLWQAWADWLAASGQAGIWLLQLEDR